MATPPLLLLLLLLMLVQLLMKACEQSRHRVRLASATELFQSVDRGSASALPNIHSCLWVAR